MSLFKSRSLCDGCVVSLNERFEKRSTELLRLKQFVCSQSTRLDSLHYVEKFQILSQNVEFHLEYVRKNMIQYVTAWTWAI